MPWFLGSSTIQDASFENAKCSTPKPPSEGDTLLGLISSDSENSPIIRKRRKRTILVRASQDPTGLNPLTETQHVSDSD